MSIEWLPLVIQTLLSKSVEMTWNLTVMGAALRVTRMAIRVSLGLGTSLGRYNIVNNKNIGSRGLDLVVY